MHNNFWIEKWENNQIGFHKYEPHHMLVEYFNSLNLRKESIVFVPLCGKSLDMLWMSEQGMQVIGCELSEIAIQQFFSESNIAYKVSEENDFRVYQSERIKIYCGDLFKLKGDDVGKVDALYDRAAMVALPLEIRKQYAAHLIDMTRAASMLLITFEYEQEKMKGPPFSINEEGVQTHYSDCYEIELLKRNKLEGTLKELDAVHECIWHLNKKVLPAKRMKGESS